MTIPCAHRNKNVFVLQAAPAAAGPNRRLCRLPTYVQSINRRYPLPLRPFLEGTGRIANILGQSLQQHLHRHPQVIPTPHPEPTSSVDPPFHPRHQAPTPAMGINAAKVKSLADLPRFIRRKATPQHRCQKIPTMRLGNLSGRYLQYPARRHHPALLPAMTVAIVLTSESCRLLTMAQHHQPLQLRLRHPTVHLTPVRPRCS